MTLGHDEAVALAAGLTGVLAVPLAVATFFAERISSTLRRETGLRVALLGGLLVSGLYLLMCSAVAWWAWNQAIATNATLIWHIPSETVFAWLFLPPILFAGACVAGAVIGLGYVAREAARKKPV